MIFSFDDINDNRNLISGDNMNRVGCPRFTKAPFLNLINSINHINKKYKGTIIEEYLFDITERPEKYIIAVGTHNDPHNFFGGELSGYKNYPSAFSLLREEYVKDLQNNNAFLLFDNSLEGFHTDFIFEYLHKECIKYNISPNRIIYITGNLLVKSQYDDWLENTEENSIKLNVFPFINFETDVYLFSTELPDANSIYPPTFSEQLEYKKVNEKYIKLFSCLNKKPRTHRVNFYKLLHFNNLLSKGMVSMENFGTEGNDFGGNENHNFCKYIFNENFLNEVKQTLPSRIYNKSNEEHNPDYYVTRFHPEVALDSWVQVVSETYFYDDYPTLFLSEKTFKVIASSQPFIIMGNKNSLVELKKLGYKTFEDFFDESYDSLDGCDRMDAIIKVLKDIDLIENKLEWFSKMKDILEWNKNILRENIVNRTPYVYNEILKLYNK